MCLIIKTRDFTVRVIISQEKKNALDKEISRATPKLKYGETLKFP